MYVSVGEARRLTRTIYDAFCEVASMGDGEVSVSDIVQYMREHDNPMGIWNVMGELSKLRQMQLVELNEESANWTLIEHNDFDTQASKVAAE